MVAAKKHVTIVKKRMFYLPPVASSSIPYKGGVNHGDEDNELGSKGGEENAEKIIQEQNASTATRAIASNAWIQAGGSQRVLTTV